VQQKREREKLMERREKRHVSRSKKQEQQANKRNVREVEVGKLKKRRFDGDTGKIQDDSAQLRTTTATTAPVFHRPAPRTNNLVTVSTMDATMRASVPRRPAKFASTYNQPIPTAPLPSRPPPAGTMGHRPLGTTTDRLT